VHIISKYTIIIIFVLQHHVCYVPLLPVGYAAGWPLDLVWTWLQRERHMSSLDFQ